MKWTVAIFLVLFLPLSCLGQDLKEQMSTELKRLNQILPSLNLPEDDTKRLSSDFKLAEEALQSDYLYLGLYRLQRFWTFVAAFEYKSSKAEIEKQGLDAFEKEWQRLGREQAGKQKLLNSRSASRLPIAIRAMAEASLSQVQPYYQSGRLYGINTTVGNGLFYLGISSANLDFVLFCQKLNLPPASLNPKLRSLEPELTSIEAEVVKAYGQPEAASQQLPYIRVNSILKLATDLDREKRYAGAFLKYLDACREFDSIKAAVPDAQGLDSIKAQIESFRSRLSPGKIDHSIGLIYLEMTQNVLDRNAAGKADKEELKRAAVIVEHVLPRYFKLINGAKQ